MACMTACPSGVRYDSLLEAAREMTASGSLRERAIFSVFPYPRRLRALSFPLRVLQRAGISPPRLPRHLGSTLLGQALRLAPPVPPPVRLPSRIPARGQRRAVVGLLTGCVQSVFFPQVNAATARVLAMEGCDVIVPPSQGCCGALSAHSGRHSEASRMSSEVASVFARAGVDAIVVNSAGCGSYLKSVTSDVVDFSEFLVSLGSVAERHPLPVTAAYHDACHLLHAQRISSEPRSLLRSIPSLSVVELSDAGNCCGSAGVYNLLQPSAAAELGARKASSVIESGASLLISANPGCSLQILASLREQGRSVRVAHPAQVLDASLRGVSLPGAAPAPAPGAV
jgi:glycolate oxidase iron-sulfur subunit